MKLYTEEQVRLLLNEILMLSSTVDDAMDFLKPIELPSDEEIENFEDSAMQMAYNTGLKDGAKWLKEHQNK